MPAQIEVSPVVNALNFLPAEGKLILNVKRGLRVVRQLATGVLMPLELGRIESQRAMPFHPPFAPAVEPLCIASRFHEELHFHLLELAGPEDEVSGSDLVPERLPNL